ncbi:MAG: hypothetical protein DLM65_04915 [Candidatus Aeolococcus gillhamiae]|uniref:Uncharacterized protein n=1 Tax=Candidatus Aeolococcus gillhamiae TaxID=3127015 RepID=A0A2W6A9M0_9BACT|nr:MAG: hypothetical protein DLM65_04915 [Candidatus Dormibacter sp. RRmetagenome_bin12]
MTITATRVLGGIGALMLGVVCLDLLPPLGLVETICAIVILATRRSGACLAALFPTVLIAVSAIAIMVTVSGPANPVMLPIAISTVLISWALARGAMTPELPSSKPRGAGT